MTAEPAADDRAAIVRTALDYFEGWFDGEGRRQDPGDRRIQVDVEQVYGTIANATVRSAVYVEYLQLVRTGDGWRIVNALWQRA
jgi:hypothetical protein